MAEDEHFAGAKDIGWRPIERGPVDGQAEIAFALRGETADGGAVEGKVVPALDEEFLVVIEHVQTAFEVGEEDGDRLDALLVSEVLEALFLDFADGGALEALFLSFQVQLLELVVGQREKITQFGGHESPRKMTDGLGTKPERYSGSPWMGKIIAWVGEASNRK